MTINLDEITRALGEITQGGWTHEWNEGENNDGGVYTSEEGKLIAIIAGSNYGRWEDKPDSGESEFKANGDFIAHAPEWLRLLVERVRKLEQELAWRGNPSATSGTCEFRRK